MKADGKLVRDRIPEIIRASGAEPEALETTRAAKAAERGTFSNRVIWTGVR